MTITLRKVRVSSRTLQRMFRNGCYLERICSKKFRPVEIKDRHASLSSGQPWCTRSQFIIYVDANGQEVVRVHQYLLENGSLGASGEPDPKALIIDGVFYYC